MAKTLLCVLLLIARARALSMALDGRDRRLLRAAAARAKNDKKMATLAFAGGASAPPRTQFLDELREQLLAHELVVVRMPDIGKKKEAKLFAEEHLLSPDTHLVQTLGHTVLLYAPHPTRPRLATELGLGVRPARGDGEPDPPAP